MRAAEDGVAVFSKFVQVIDAISTGQMVNVSQLSQHLNIPRSTVHRLLSTLVSHEVLTPDYHVGNRLVLWAHQALKTSDLRDASVPVLERLVRRFGETASIYVRVGTYRICLERREGVAMLRHTVEVGEPLPLHKGSGGRALLAWLDDETRNELWQASVKRFETHLERAEPDWQAIRQQGWTVSMGERDPGLASVSVPIVHGSHNEVIAAVCVSGPLERIVALQVDVLAPEVLSAATEIASRMAGVSFLLQSQQASSPEQSASALQSASTLQSTPFLPSQQSVQSLQETHENPSTQSPL